MLSGRSTGLLVLGRGNGQPSERIQEQDGAPDFGQNPVLVGDRVLARAAEANLRDPSFAALGERDGDRDFVPPPVFARNLGVNLPDPLDSLEDGAWDGIEVARPPGFRPGFYRGRGSGIISRSGARSAALEDAGGLSGFHRLMNRNKELELELQRVKGMIPNPLSSGRGVDVNPQLEVLLNTKGGIPGGTPGPDCGVDHDLQLVEKERSNGGTQHARLNATVRNSQDSTAVVCDINQDEDAGATTLEFQPPVAGVRLEEYISVAIAARNNPGKGAKSGGSKRSLGGRLGSTSCDDPFPPLSRLADGVLGLGGDSASSRTSHSAELGRLHDAHGKAVLKNKGGEGNKFSWTDLLRSSKPDNVCVDLHYVEPTIIDGEACAVFSLEEEAENLKQWKNTLLCYVVGKSPTYYQFLKAMQRQWNSPDGLEVFSRENGIFFCKFGSESDMKKVIKDGPWYLDGKLVVVKKFSGETTCEEDMLSSIPIWVKLPCLPVQWWSIEGVSKVVSPLGHPLYFDITSAAKSRIAYARCCVKVAMEKNLPSSVLCMGGDKVKKRQNIIYDWVPKRCSACKEFGHMVAECGGAQPRQQQEMKGGWNNNKKMGKGQQVYRPKEKNQSSEVEGKLEKQDILVGSSKGAIYKTNLFNSRPGTIKATSTNSFNLLVDMEEVDTGDKRQGGNKGNHKYFCSDDEDEVVEDHAPQMVDQNQNKMESVEPTNEEEEETELDLVMDPSTKIKGVEVEVVASMSADEDTREREARGANEELAFVNPANLETNEVAGSVHEELDSDDEIQESDGDKDEEQSIRNYGKPPAECGMPPSLTVPNPNYKGEMEAPKEIKKVKKRSTPPPERPAGSRTTRHSFKVG